MEARERERERERERMVQGPTIHNPALFPPASLPSRTLFSRHFPLLLSPAISSSNAETLKRASLFIYGRKTGHGFLVSASGRRRRESPIIGAADSDDDGNGWEEEEEEEEEEEGEGEELVPFQEMSRWLQNKPAGFGEGKTYDTTIEEKLLEEMERSQKAQLANINKLSNGPKNTAGPKKEEQQPNENVVVPNGTRIRIYNLPRKKNIHRDLQLAFKGFPGIVNISPAVTGNRKTRDPICKGFALLDFESEEAVDRFVLKYSKQNVLFGKVQKQITCDVINPHRSSHHPEQSTDDTETFTQPKLTDLGDEMPGKSEINNLFSDHIAVDDQIDESALLVNCKDGLSSQFEETGTTIDHLGISHLNDAENCSPVNGVDLGSNDPESSFQKRRERAAPRKKTVKTKSVKTSIVTVPRSMARLKVKERTVLTGVFSKYGGKVVPDLSKQS